MTPDSMANEVEEQKLLLKQYLGQYYYAKMKKKQLEARLRTFRENMLGTKGMQYSPVPRSQTNSVGDGPATQVIRAMEIEDRIESQKAEMAKTMRNHRPGQAGDAPQGRVADGQGKHQVRTQGSILDEHFVLSICSLFGDCKRISGQ